MLRSVSSLVALLAAAAAVGPAFAADMDDWGNDFGNGGFRAGYPTEPQDWAGLGDTDDPLRFEFGLRYYYSMGSQQFAINSGLAGDRGTMSEKDTSQFVEGHLRIDDASTRTYAKAVAGLAYSINGDVTDNSGTTTVTDGHIGYLGADFGYALAGDAQSFALSPFVGYMYWNNSPNTYHDNYITATSSDDITYDPVSGQTSFPGDSTVDDINLNMLRLGISADANLGGFLDVSAEVAAVPYAAVSGTLGASSGSATGAAVYYDNPSSPSAGPTGPTGAYNIHEIQASPTTISGWGYGGMAQAAVGIHPTDNLVLRVGGRAWYVQGSVDASFDRAVIGDPSDSTPPVAGTPADPGPPAVPATPDELNSPNFDTPPTFSRQTYISRSNPFSMFRYGLFAEATFSF